MKAVSLSGSPRANVGKTDAKALRKEGRVPGVLYGGEKQIHFSAAEADFKPLIFTDAVQTVELEIEGAKYNAILQDIQYHPVRDNILHVDFLQIHDDKPITIAIPVKHVGVAPGVREGGKLIGKLRKLKVRAFLKDLPDTIDVDISELNIGQSVRVSQLNAGALTFLDGPNVEIAAVTATRASRQADEAAAKQ